ncbi:Oidioi.mRNA.OKI2018_I69.chr1.g700.t1.cds [Oikopleura dioica]|uniref:Oidioi.mRNA.OKI2018_I69.chr1.g700.t1.cds n=1 Tax=Oikopleura dioica TaxID=34765 RepID=A0ABN7SKP0_OIKDI|nr:Oidioi.mRNA.OKI2018_I69.chr1.g700.t1.cds [Oikopleura dioica]
MFRNRELRSHAIYTCTDWCGGVYATPTYQGSRSGGNIACAWGVMNLLGREGYVERAKRVIGSAHKLRDAARNIHGIEVVGNPQEHADTLSR